MQVEEVNIDDIKMYENNAKLHPDWHVKQIEESIKEFGNNDPIAIDRNNVIIEGHGRYLALKELGYKKIEVIRLNHLNDKERRAYTLAHNKINMNTGFDDEMLEDELEELDDIDMEKYGFDDDIPEFESYIDSLMESGFVGEKTELDKFSVTFNIPIEYKDEVNQYIKDNGKGHLIDIMLEEIES